ncbi:MAG: hypothetical protein IT184_12795 [Acidobacteria bacterium]|nr:hypothetical protein [Acidobacteriota bacterium]
MSLVRRITTIALLICFTASASGIVSAQAVSPPTAPNPQPVAQNDTLAAGLVDGEMLAEAQRTGGKLGAGLAIGVLTGLIGTGIGYFVIGPEPLSPEALQRGAGKGPDYQLGLKTGWEKKTRSKKRHAFLAGGLLGTAAFFVLVASASSSNQ